MRDSGERKDSRSRSQVRASERAIVCQAQIRLRPSPWGAVSCQVCCSFSSGTQKRFGNFIILQLLSCYSTLALFLGFSLRLQQKLEQSSACDIP